MMDSKLGIVRCFILSFLANALLVKGSYLPQRKNFAHIMDLYRGLVNHSNSDIVLAVDAADGVKEDVFNEMKNLSEMAVQCLSHVKGTRIAVASFAEKVKLVHRFQDCQKNSCIIKSLRSLRPGKGKRATARVLKEAKRILKSDGRRKTKWTLVLITFGAPRIARKRTLVVAQRLQKVGADMYLLAIGKRAFNSYETLKSIVRPFESVGRKIVQRLFLFRGPQDRADFVMTKAVLKIVCAKRRPNLMSKLRMLG
ncbi:uncharacterized protein LOC135692819 [Rhopilema esculentum]|uniref:uncharacterized protein LOC135692819 n=1 Tax=Rhopilema esculentum TaxID=499914 RepID=UPI0031D06926